MRHALYWVLLGLLLTSLVPYKSNAALITSNVVINEFEQDPAGDERANNGEFVELFNPTNSAVNISGWKICTTHGQTYEYTIAKGTVMSPGPSWWTVNLVGQFIDNSEDSLILRDSLGKVVDQTLIQTDSSDDGHDWQRNPDAGTSWTFKLATKGTNNSPNPIPEFQYPILMIVAAVLLLTLCSKAGKRTLQPSAPNSFPRS